MTQDIVTLYVSLLSQFFSLSSVAISPAPAARGSTKETTEAPPLPSFVPENSNAATIGHWLLKTINELTECVTEMASLELPGEASASLQELLTSTRWRFEEALCAAWVRG